MLNLFIKKRYNDLKFELIPFLREHDHEHHIRKGYNKLIFNFLILIHVGGKNYF